ncbi:MAG: hypothetical protein VR65_02485 [Desulfobulbaceae bacterium BRH_c16a]|nr:MAG: hypothetical protein VR65_02485 [Desulfobulbaceae bacterium BRH_c16a]
MRNFKILNNQLKELSLKEFFSLLKQTLFFDELILVYKLDTIKIQAQPEEVEGVIIKKGDLEDLKQARQTLKPLPWEFQCYEFDGVNDFFVAKDDGGIQHISWIYFHDHRNRLLSLGKREAEIKFCLTLPAARGRGIYPKILLSALSYLNSCGIQRVYICVHKDNNSSIRGIEKAGFTRVGEIKLKKFMGIQMSPRFDTYRRVQ